MFVGSLSDALLSAKGENKSLRQADIPLLLRLVSNQLEMLQFVTEGVRHIGVLDFRCERCFGPRLMSLFAIGGLAMDAIGLDDPMRVPSRVFT